MTEENYEFPVSLDNLVTRPCFEPGTSWTQDRSSHILLQSEYLLCYHKKCFSKLNCGRR